MASSPVRPEVNPVKRRPLYYTGWAVVVIGLGLFLSAYVTGATSFGSFEPYQGPTWSEIMRVIGGIVLMCAGGWIIKAASSD